MHHLEVSEKERLTFAILLKVEVYNKTQFKAPTKIQHRKGKIKCFG